MRLLYSFLLTVLLSIASLTAIGQRNCASTEYLEQQKTEDPKRQMRMDRIEDHTRQFIMNQENRSSAPVITIPVVVHVVWNTAAENISDAQILSQIEVLNEDFRRLNSDADNVWGQAADTEIEFCLANVDPNGNATTGITRTQTSNTSFSTNDNVKFTSSGGKDAWPSSSYMNIWICDISGGIIGYAQFPGGPASTDGIVVDYTTTGNIGTATAPFDLGRTATHEVGHYLNLRHIWGDGGCGASDLVADTPDSDGPNNGCNTSTVSCGTTDMVQNYMDYTDDDCMNLFTAGQTSRMRALFNSGGFRASLLNSTACGTPAEPTCDDGIQNQGETGVDCGGPCPGICPTCDDGILNNGEIEVDCGGPNCSVCPCTGEDVTLTILLDNYPEETSWSITDAGGGTVANGGTYGSQPDGSTVVESICLNDGCYTFTINDSFGDGLCCGFGIGNYSLTSADGSLLASGGEFGSSESTPFCIASGGLCASPADLATVEIGFGGSNPRVNATWINPEGTTDCEVRGGRISATSYNAGEPEFINLANTQVITQTSGSTVNFNIALYNNPNIPFSIGQRYGFDVRCACADGSGYSAWANITPQATFVVPSVTPGTELAGSDKNLETEAGALSLFPNPADGVLSIMLTGVGSENVIIEVLDMRGRQVMGSMMNDLKAGRLDLNVASLESGLYMIRATGEGVQLTARWVKR
jgi:hypothetical protein